MFIWGRCWLSLIIFPNLPEVADMNRSTRSSYEGFRRKSSLNTLDHSSNSQASEAVHTRTRHREDLKLVENISQELQKLTKRSFGSRSFCEDSTHQTFLPQESSEPRLSNTNPTFSLQHIDPEPEEPGEVKKEKVLSLAFFNKFDTIEESHSLCEQEILDEKPATARNATSKAVGKPGQNKNSLKSSTPHPVRKVTGPAKTEQLPNGKRQRLRPDLKNDLTELDKMKRELETKKFVKEASKPLVNSVTRRPRQSGVANIKQVKDAQQINRNQPYQQTQKAEVPKPVKNVPKSTLLSLQAKNAEQGGSQPVESKRERIETRGLEKAEEEPMAATRMLSEREKAGLIRRVMGLREIIEKNEVCSDNLEEIGWQLSLIEELLTR